MQKNRLGGSPVQVLPCLENVVAVVLGLREVALIARALEEGAVDVDAVVERGVVRRVVVLDAIVLVLVERPRLIEVVDLLLARD